METGEKNKNSVFLNKEVILLQKNYYMSLFYEWQKISNFLVFNRTET